MSNERDGKKTVFVGTYNGDNPEGVFVFRFDPATGELAPTGLTARTRNPSFLALHPTGRHLYAVSEVADAAGKESGGVSAFAIEPATGALTFVNQHLSQGVGPCHLCVDATGSHLLVANYRSGTLGVLPILPNGRLTEATHRVQHRGAGVNPDRQEGPHAHSITLDPSNRFALGCDLGIDKVMGYRFDAEEGRLISNEPPWAGVKPGAGPRHLAFAPGGRHVYVINELDSTITAFAFDPIQGALREAQAVSTVPAGFRGENTGSDVHVHPSGRFLYGSNRGHDSIAVFAIDEASGALTAQGHDSTLGRTPRNFALDPTGRFLLAANQDSDSIVSFRIDPATGRLAPAGNSVSVRKPTCVQFLNRV